MGGDRWRKACVPGYILLVMVPIGTFAVGRSKNLNTMYIYQSLRTSGFVYEWSLVKGNKFQCFGCKRLRKMRCISIQNGTLISSGKHPEDEHHDQCQPLPEGGLSLIHI